MQKVINAIDYALFAIGVAGLATQVYSSIKKKEDALERQTIVGWFSDVHNRINLLEIRTRIDGAERMVDVMTGIKNVIAYESVDRFQCDPVAVEQLTRINAYIDGIIAKY